MKPYILYVLVFTCLAMGCQPKKKKETFDLKKLEWLLGTWKGENEGQVFYENWDKTSDTQFSNTNFNISRTDTTVSSSSTIEVQKDNIFFSSDNTLWELTEQTDNQSVFENKERGEVFTFGLTDKNEWKALFNYPTTQIKYVFTKVVPPIKLPK